MFRTIKPVNLQENPFKLVGSDWMLISARKDSGAVNAMTASWGGMGILWGKPVAFIFVRPQRFTKGFVDEAGTFALSFFGGERREMLNYMGKASGRDEDKIKMTGLTPAEGTPYFEEATLAIVCKKLYAAPIEESAFVDQSVVSQCYPQKDFHTLYVGEILEIKERV